ncbi:MAG TPA: class I tRNA ligase family protein, partial [Bacillales bacterium]|nr:class I tRNA ligase family protein [Bacillales bacterium]
MDVWFDSGSSHQAVLMQRDELRRPADLYLEGSDQYRGWFNSSLSTAVAMTGEAPYKQIVSHGFTLDGEGHKMSKSLGNVIDPLKVMKQLGADIIRLWVSSVDYQADARLSNEILKQVAETYRKIRNTFRFMLGNLHDFDPEKDRVAVGRLSEFDRYMLINLNGLIDRVKKGYNEYQFSSVYNAVHNYCTIELSSYYLDVAKDTLYTKAENDPSRRAMQTVIYETLVAMTKLLAPIIPHTADEVWNYIPGARAESVHLTDMPNAAEVKNAESVKDKWDRFTEVRDEVLKALEAARIDKQIGKSLEASVKLYPDLATTELLAEVNGLEQLLIVSKAEVAGNKEEAPDTAKVYDHAAVEIRRADGETCDRCWNIKESVGSDQNHPKLCADCAETVKKYY